MKVDGVTPVLFPRQYKNTPKNSEFSLDPNNARLAEEKTQLPGREKEADHRDLARAVEQLNKLMHAYNTEISFQLHESSGEYMVKVVNSADKTVIREIPPERVLDMVAYFKKIIGIIIDEFI